MWIFFKKNKYLVFAFLGLWLLMAAGFLYLIIFLGGWDFQIALNDTLISTLSLFVLLTLLKYVVRFSVHSSSGFFSKLPAALLAGSLLVVLWLYGSKIMVGSAVGNLENYPEFLNNTLVLRVIWGGMASILVFLMFLVFFMQKKSLEANHRATQLEDLVRQTELHALKNQLNPHFMYNSLNSISSLTHSNPDKAREMLICLSDFLRYALKQDAMQMTTLSNELENVQLYLNIERIRFGDRLQTSFDAVDESLLRLEVPVMILQPLFENSVKHGLQKTPGIVLIQFEANETGENSILLSVKNTYDSEFARFRAEGVGLGNIRNRLRLIYGNGRLLTVHAGENLFAVSIALPKRLLHE